MSGRTFTIALPLLLALGGAACSGSEASSVPPLGEAGADTSVADGSSGPDASTRDGDATSDARSSDGAAESEPHDTGSSDQTVDVAGGNGSLDAPADVANGDSTTPDATDATDATADAMADAMADATADATADAADGGSVCSPPCPVGTTCSNGQCLCQNGGLLCGTACVDSTSDPANCGTCGNTCSGATPACLDGTCGPTWSYVNLGGTAAALAVDSNNLYWTDDALPGGQLMELPKSGGPAVTLASSTTEPPGGIAVDTSNVYFGLFGSAADAGSIDSIPIGGNGGMPTVLASGGAGVLALSGSTLCFGGEAVVGCLPVTGGSPTILNTVQSGFVFAMAVDATNAYWTLSSTNGAVFSAPIAGGPVTLLVAHTDLPMGIAVDANNVYWINGGAGTVNAMPKNGGPVTTLATGPGSPKYLALDSGYLFWSAVLDPNNGAILKMPVTGGTPTVLAWKTYGAGPLVVDAQFVYFVLENGSIAKCPR